MAIEKYIIDKSDLPALLRGEDLPIKPKGNIKGFCVEIAGTLTNGDVIKAMFPNARVSEIFPSFNDDEVYYILIEKLKGATNGMRVMKSWWNAPYMKEVEE